MREGVEILLVGTWVTVYSLPPSTRRQVFSGQKTDLGSATSRMFYEDRSVNANESVGFKRFREDREIDSRSR